MVTEMLNDAVRKRTSDIHIEPGKNHLSIRFRTDGYLFIYRTMPMDRLPSLISQIKLMANLDIGEKRLPQDGNLSYNDMQFRVSTMPTIFGEKMVLRLLQPHMMFKTIAQLGMTVEQQSQIKRWIHRPHGLIIVTGPTGAGKSTTLYTLLNEMNQIDRNIVTLEDPVEIRLDGINQVQIHERTGLTFARGLRALLRQDPDIMMIGEIRDEDSADIVVRAALTGHLVLTSLHTIDTVGAITRLLDMGIPPYLVASSISGVIAQRLVRKRCFRCEGSGHCTRCNGSGYFGRVAAFELLPVDESLQELIIQQPSASQLRQFVYSRGVVPLSEHLLSLVNSGQTTMSELQRVVTVGAPF